MFVREQRGEDAERHGILTVFVTESVRFYLARRPKDVTDIVLVMKVQVPPDRRDPIHPRWTIVIDECVSVDTDAVLGTERQRLYFALMPAEWDGGQITVAVPDRTLSFVQTISLKIVSEKSCRATGSGHIIPFEDEWGLYLPISCIIPTMPSS